MFDLSGKHVVVVGLGASGVAAARLCAGRGARVTGTDGKSLVELGESARSLSSVGVEVLAGAIDRADFSKADVVVVSPGVPNFDALDAAAAAGVKVIGEVELAYIARKHLYPVVAIGGTNGKSTTTMLVAAILEACGMHIFSGGNLGEPLALHADERFDAAVLEVSSFQMERVEAFRPFVSVLLNITPDHLDRYPTLEAYAHAKGNAFVRQEAEDYAVVPFGDDLCMKQARRGEARIATFGDGGVEVTPEEIVDTQTADHFLRSEILLAGGHNALNVAAAIAAVRGFDVPADVIRLVLKTFRGLPHRVELVAKVAGVAFYDDSKGTNVGASVTALRGLSEGKAVLIAGGRDKGGSYEPLVSALADRGRAVVVIGEAADAIARAVGDRLPLRRARTMDEAVVTARSLAHAGDAVLLSPACSSFDMFKDYKHRGEEFARAVRAIENRLQNREKTA